MKKGIFLFFAVCMVLGVIFYLSSMTYEEQSLIPLLEKYLPHEWVISNFSWVELQYVGSVISVENYGTSYFVEFFIRKGAHLMIFGTLAVFLYLFLNRRINKTYAIALSIFLTTIYATLDEVHQGITGGRTPMWQDVLLDVTGAIIGVSLVVFARKIREKRMVGIANV